MSQAQTKKIDILIVSDNKKLFLSYENLLNDYTCEVIEVQNFKDFLNIQSEKYKCIIFDISLKHLLVNISKISLNLNNIFYILITPYFRAQINDYEAIDSAALVLTKPYKMEIFLAFLKDKMSSFEHQEMLENKNRVLIYTIENNPQKMGIFDLSGKLYYANKSYLLHNEISQEAIDTLVFDDLKQCDYKYSNIIENSNKEAPLEIVKMSKGYWYKSLFYLLEDNFIIHICNDITQEKIKELELEKAAVYFDNSSEGIMISSSKNIILSVNEAFCTITGYTKDEIIGKSPRVLKSGLHKKNFYETMWNSLIYNNSWKGEIWNKRKNTEIYPEWLSIKRIKNSQQKEEFYIATFTDLSSIKENDKKVAFYANHDALTGLANRFQFELQLANSMQSASRHGTKLGVMFIDVDKFKDINDTYGHNYGDKILVEISRRLGSAIRGEDLLARLGGDEFVIIVKELKDSHDIKVVYEKIRLEMTKPIKVQSETFLVTLSVGVSIFPDDGATTEEIIKNADIAMYEVKRNTRNNLVIFEPHMSSKISQKVLIQNELQRALEQNEFVMFYQPIVDFSSSKTIGAEALVRWNHPQRGILYPNDFLDYIFGSEMEVPFGYKVIENVLQDAHALLALDKDFVISLNVTAAHLFDPLFVSKLLHVCNDFGVSPCNIELEMLETHIISNPSIAQEKFQMLQGYGFTIAIDDFGTGYSSLSYLKSYKVDKLKIDQSFVRDIMSDKEDEAITKAIITLAEIFSMKVQAEGVETQEIFDKLKEFHCDYSQGYLHAKPLPLDQFIQRLQDEQSSFSINR